MKAATSTSGDGVVAVRTESPAETSSLAERLGRRLAGGETIALTGPLGAGKTWFVKGLARGLDIDPRDVTSPTFLVIHQLAGRLALAHLDAYRTGGAAELAEMGAGDLFRPDSVVVVEWADRAEGILPDDRLDLSITVEGENSRVLAFLPRGPRHATLLAGLAEGET